MWINLEPYFHKEIPILHPKSLDYIRFWKEEKRRVIEGLWVGGGHWITPYEYFYRTHGTIMLNARKRDKVKSKSRPELRDTDREIFRCLTVCRGFSGFSEDFEYSCDLRLSPESLAEEPILPSHYFDEDYRFLFTPEGNIKRFVEPLTYINQFFPRSMGYALYENQALDFMLLGARGGGKSYLTASVISHEFLFNGAKRYTQESIDNPAAVDIVVGSGELKKSKEILNKTKLCLENLPGSFGRVGEFTPSPLAKSRLSGSWDDEIRHEYKQKVVANWELAGTKARILHVNYENPDAASGTRPSISIIEECGLIPNLIDVYTANLDCLLNGTDKFGTQIYIGTSGNFNKIAACEKMFRNPKSFKILDFGDDEGNRTAYFLPITKTLGRFKDKTGLTDDAKALAYELKEREKMLNDKGGVNAALAKYIVYHPIRWKEMFVNNRGSVLPTAEISNRLEQLIDNYLLQVEKRVILSFDKEELGGVRCEEDATRKLEPLNTFQLEKGKSKEGCVVIYEYPKTLTDPNTGVEYIPPDLYIGTLDIYVSEDSESGGSLAACYICRNEKYLLELPSRKRIVASYVGKPYYGLEILYSTVEKLLRFYGVSAENFNYENNRAQGVKNHAERRGYSYMLSYKPTIFGKVEEKAVTVTTERGYFLSGQLKIEAVQLASQWLLEVVDQERVELPDGSIITKDVRNVDELDCRALLQEMAQFSFTEGNYDRFMSFIGFIIKLFVHRRNVEIGKTRKPKTNPLGTLLNNSKFDKLKLHKRRMEIEALLKTKKYDPHNTQFQPTIPEDQLG